MKRTARQANVSKESFMTQEASGKAQESIMINISKWVAERKGIGE